MRNNFQNCKTSQLTEHVCNKHSEGELANIGSGLLTLVVIDEVYNTLAHTEETRVNSIFRIIIQSLPRQ